MMVEKISAREFARRAGCDEKQVRRALRDGILVRDANGKLDCTQLSVCWRRPNVRTMLRVAQRDIDESTREMRDAWLTSTAWVVLQIAGALDIEPGSLIELLEAHVHEQLAELDGDFMREP